MKRIAIIIFAFVFIWPATAKVNGMDAAEYFNLGLKSTMTRTKIEYFTRALELNPTFTDAYEKRGMLYFFQKKYDQMIRDFQNFIDLAPGQAKAFLMLGVGYLKTGNCPAAIYNLTRALELEPGLAGAYSNRAEAYFLSGRYEQAIEDATSAIRIGGDAIILTEAYRIRYKTYWKLGNENEAYRNLGNAWRSDPRVWNVWKTKNGGLHYLEYSRRMGLMLLIAVAAALIFGAKLKPPEK